MTDSQISESGATRGLYVLGVVLIVFGVLAIAFPLATTIAVKVFVGWIFILSGAFQIYQSFSTKEWGGFIWNLVIGIMYVVVGVWMAFDLLSGIVGLTILLAAMFVVTGVFEAMMANNMRPDKGWGWLMFSGVISILAGVLIVMGLPSTAAWAIGLLVGLNMISSGFAFLKLGALANRLD